MSPSGRRARGRKSAGLLLFRHAGEDLEVLLVHPGGPFWATRDLGAWSVPKGECEDGEDPRAAAWREFGEELGSPAPEGEALELGEVRQKAGKTVLAWAIAGDLDAEHDHQQQVRDGVAAAVRAYPAVPRGRPGRVVRAGRGARTDQPGSGGAARSSVRGAGGVRGRFGGEAVGVPCGGATSAAERHGWGRGRGPRSAFAGSGRYCLLHMNQYLPRPRWGPDPGPPRRWLPRPSRKPCR